MISLGLMKFPVYFVHLPIGSMLKLCTAVVAIFNFPKNWKSGHTRYSVISSVCQRCCCHCSSVLFVSVMFSPFNLILWDHWRKWNQSWQKCYLDALFLCKSEIQDGHCHSTNLTGPYEKKIKNGN
jgi:hypothetical protein